MLFIQFLDVNKYDYLYVYNYDYYDVANFLKLIIILKKLLKNF